MNSDKIKMLHCKLCNRIYFLNTTTKCDKCNGELEIKEYETPINCEIVDFKVPEGY